MKKLKQRIQEILVKNKINLNIINELINKENLVSLNLSEIYSILNHSKKVIEKRMEIKNIGSIKINTVKAKGMIINITGSERLKLDNTRRIIDIISKKAEPDAKMLWLAKIDEKLGDRIKIHVLYTQ